LLLEVVAVEADTAQAVLVVIAQEAGFF